MTCGWAGGTRYGDVAAVEGDSGALVDTALDEADHAVLGLLGDEGTQVGAGGEARAQLELPGTLDQLGDPTLPHHETQLN